MQRIIVLIGLAALLIAACTVKGTTSQPTTGPGNTTPTPGITTPPVVARPQPGVATDLVAFDRCEALLDWVINEAVDRVGPYGFEGYGDFRWMGFVPELALARDAAVETTTTAAAGAPVGDGGFTSTNIQEAGVDEPDLVKTDGERIVVVSGSRLHVLTVDDGELELVGSIDLDLWSESMFLDGDTVTLVANEWGHATPMPLIESDMIAPYPQQPIVTLIEIDISDASDPELTRTLQIDGRYVSSRLVDGEIRLVVSAQPTGFAWHYPEGGGLRAEREAEQKNRQIVLDSTIENWVPYYVLTDISGRDRVVAEGTLVDCGRVHHPEEFSGLTTLSLVTLGEEGLTVEDATSVFADGDIVYSSELATYVATNPWTNPAEFDEDEIGSTKIHRFGLFSGGAEYAGSGTVDGWMLSQWSMSEHEGHLRVATTSEPQWRRGDESSSSVTVLEIQEGQLETVGTVGDLGKGEQIYSVRFMGDVGYVVTFRQIDPLYVLDLSDPADPTVAGELKIPGYSAYLHPISADTLLGVGQDADREGRTEGTQISLFDVSDPTDPDRIDRLTMTDAYSEVEWDHHAFLYHAGSGTVVVPVQRWWVEKRSGDEHYGGTAMVLDVDDDRIRERGELRHSDDGNGWYPQIRRTLVVGDALITISEMGVMSNDLGDLEEIDYITFT